MLSYQDVVTIKLGTLTTAATDWDAMADGFEDLETVYHGRVEPVATDGTWTGVSAAAAAAQFAGTRQQFADAQKEARAIASLLRDAHTQFSELTGKVEGLVEQAKADDMSVNGKGEAVYDFSKLTPMRHDEDYPKYVQQRKDAEAGWTKKIKDAVQAVDDADQGVKLALYEAAGIKSWFERAMDQARGQSSHTFNGSAVGDIEVYEAHEAKEYADRVMAGDKLEGDDLKEWQRLLRDNSQDRVFTRTYLDSLGPDGTLKLANKIDDLAYSDDTRNKNAYLQINGGLSDSLATATHVPDFKDANGKHLRFGSREYYDAFNDWVRTDDARFYTKWCAELREHGDDKYDLEAAGDKVNTVSKGHDQQIRGYQSLATLMQQGHGYSPQFVSDVTDDMISMEKDHPGIWKLYGDFSGKGGDGWFANDPVDGVLKVMSHDPEAATGYLDPGTNGSDAEHRGNDRLHYLLDRDSDFVKTTRWQGPGGNVEVDAGTVEDADAKRGLGAVIEAATTGRAPGGAGQADGIHTAEQARVMQDTISLLDRGAGGDSVHHNLQDSLAHSLSDYAPDTHNILTEDAHYDYNVGGDARTDGDGGHINVSKDTLTRVLRGASDSDRNFALLYEAERAQAAQDLANAPDSPGRGTENWDIRARDAGMGIGTFNAIGSDVILDDRDARKGWADDVAKYTYHAGGAPITLIPGVGDAAQRVLDSATYEWSKDVKAEADQVAKVGVSDDLGAKSQGTHDLINQWAAGRGRDYKTDPIVINMRDEASQSYITSRTAAFSALGRD